MGTPLPEAERQRLLKDWLSTRPLSVRRLAEEFPIATTFDVGGVRYYLLGYNEADSLIVTPLDPSVNWDAALAAKTYLCAEHVREAVADSG